MRTLHQLGFELTSEISSGEAETEQVQSEGPRSTGSRMSLSPPPPLWNSCMTSQPPLLSTFPTFGVNLFHSPLVLGKQVS